MDNNEQDVQKRIFLYEFTTTDDTTFDGTNTEIVEKDTFLPPYIGIPFTQSDFSLAMDIASNDDDEYTSLRWTVSDSCINYNFEAGRSINSRDVSSIYRGESDRDVMYQTRSLTEISG